jgi:hypothetical protein
MIVRVLQSKDILREELKLLSMARSNMPYLPIDEFDLLIVDRMGKNISGVGMDSNIIGRMKINGQPEPEKPRIRSIMVTDLTDETHGNAAGVGLADVITKKLYDKIDFESTYKNIVTSSFLERGKIPVVAKTCREACEIALRNCGAGPQGAEKIIRIKDTLHLSDLYVSGAVLNEIGGNDSIEILHRNVPLFGADDQLVDFDSGEKYIIV